MVNGCFKFKYKSTPPTSMVRFCPLLAYTLKEQRQTPGFLFCISGCPHLQMHLQALFLWGWFHHTPDLKWSPSVWAEPQPVFLKTSEQSSTSSNHPFTLSLHAWSQVSTSFLKYYRCHHSTLTYSFKPLHMSFTPAVPHFWRITKKLLWDTHSSSFHLPITQSLWHLFSAPDKLVFSHTYLFTALLKRLFLKPITLAAFHFHFLLLHFQRTNFIFVTFHCLSPLTESQPTQLNKTQGSNWRKPIPSLLLLDLLSSGLDS